MNDWNLNFWKTGEYQAIAERIDDIRKSGLQVCPLHKDMIKRPFKETSYASLKVALIGQDPYPNPMHATGLAFDLPPDLGGSLPPTYRNLIKEYCDDLHYPQPKSLSLRPWAERGVFLWNTIPTCTAYKSLSHVEWGEYDELTKELRTRLQEAGALVVTLGATARQKFIPSHSDGVPSYNHLHFSHPSPRASLVARSPFLGGRMFSTINAKLVQLGKEPIDWRLE